VFNIDQSEVCSNIDIDRELRVLKHRGLNKVGDLDKNVGSGALVKSVV